MKEICLSGASDQQYANDARIRGTYRGAMSYYAMEAIRQAQYNITYAQLHDRVNDLLRAARFRNQNPQLEGKQENKDRQIFV